MRLRLENIGKIKEATIDMQGITVIAGENNTGKSTVGKALFAIFNSFYEIQNQIYKERLQSIENVMQLIYRNLFFIDGEKMRSIDECSEEILLNKATYIESPSKLKKYIIEMLDLDVVSTKNMIERINLDDLVERVVDILRISDQEIFNSVVNKKMNAEFGDQLLNVFSEREGNISLTVQKEILKVRVLEDSVMTERKDYSLHTEAIYIDDPFVLDDIDFRLRRKKEIGYTDHRAQLIDKLLRKNENTSVVDEIVVENRFKDIYQKLNRVCDGKMVRQRNGRMGYRTKNMDKSLNVKNLSTGLKTFVILKTLLMNGAIENNGTIILDEPEIHLHPEWQLMFAELIVLLSKEFDVNILLNTHSPYFLRAVQVYSAKYEVADTCKYYLSEFVEEGKATVIDVTDNVDKIFVKLAQPLQMLEDERWNID